MNIYEKLNKIQTELKAPKSNYNSFGKYSYRSCEDIMEAVKPILDKYKLALVVKDDIVLVGDRYYVKATATLYDTENDGANISGSAYAREDETKKGMDLAQVTGSVSSYARKYALNGLFAIDDVKDSDATNKHGKEAPTVKKSNDGFDTLIIDQQSSLKVTTAQLKRLFTMANKAGVKKEVLEGQIKKEFGCEVKEMNRTQYYNVCGRLEAKINK